MKRAIISSLLVVAWPTLAMGEGTVDPRLRNGLRMHDAGDYSGAIAAYEAYLADHPHDPLAVYELGLSLMYRGTDLDAAVGRLQAELASAVEQRPQLQTVLGSLLDAAGKMPEGEQAFRAGLARAPDDHGLHYNLALNLQMQDRWEDSIPVLESAARIEPRHAKTWIGLGKALQRTGYGQRAVFAFARGVAVEPDGPLARDASTTMSSLVFAGISRGTDGMDIDITLSGDLPEGDPRSVEAIVMAIFAANRFVDRWQKASDAEFFAHALEQLTQSHLEVPDDAAYWGLVLPFFDDARKAGHMEALGYELRRAGGDADAAKWIEHHRKRATACSEWVAAWGKGPR